jgi:hypothetical protein
MVALGSTYGMWADGIREQLRRPMFKETWSEDAEEVKEHRTFPYEHLRKLLDEPDSDAGDPLVKRRLRGLTGLGGVSLTYPR